MSLECCGRLLGYLQRHYHVLLLSLLCYFASIISLYPPSSHIFSTYLLNRVVCWCCVDSCLDLGSGMMAMVNPLPLRKLPLCCCFHTYPLILLTTIQDKTIDTFPLRSTYSGENTNFYTKYFNSHPPPPPMCKIEKWKGVLELLTNLKSFPSNFLAFVNTTVLAGMLRPRANVSVAKRAWKEQSQSTTTTLQDSIVNFSACKESGYTYFD